MSTQKHSDCKDVDDTGGMRKKAAIADSHKKPSPPSVIDDGDYNAVESYSDGAVNRPPVAEPVSRPKSRGKVNTIRLREHSIPITLPADAVHDATMTTTTMNGRQNWVMCHPRYPKILWLKIDDALDHHVLVDNTPKVRHLISQIRTMRVKSSGHGGYGYVVVKLGKSSRRELLSQWLVLDDPLALGQKVGLVNLEYRLDYRAANLKVISDVSHKKFSAERFVLPPLSDDDNSSSTMKEDDDDDDAPLRPVAAAAAAHVPEKRFYAGLEVEGEFNEEHIIFCE